MHDAQRVIAILFVAFLFFEIFSSVKKQIMRDMTHSLKLRAMYVSYVETYD